MKVLSLPHHTAPYRCPVNGLCDVYQWKTGQRIPEELLFDSRIGFKLVSHLEKRRPLPSICLREGLERINICSGADQWATGWYRLKDFPSQRQLDSLSN